jgi:hypothetical protein
MALCTKLLLGNDEEYAIKIRLIDRESFRVLKFINENFRLLTE